MTLLVLARLSAGDPRGTHVVAPTESVTVALCGRTVVPVDPATAWRHTGRPVTCSRCSARAFVVHARARRE